ncbi:G kinase-anchoring protein 1 [Galendromus occidentalis]|uniref:G kinase-anchoring protein 1 n=1 Tax=Galendromus occidentalis TaxID=34638 RepID=A0AAJ6VZ95_9ACAR|nr:G kinase-anchoring protein 1 [Galendromus occidentalis]
MTRCFEPRPNCMICHLRFSVLKMDVPDPSERKKAPVKAQPVVTTKKQQQQPNKNKAKNNNNNSNNKKKKAQQSGDSSKFDEWKKRDEDLMESTYEKELQEALLMSRLEQEKQTKQVEQRSEAAVSESAESKKKGKVVLSLQEFHEKFVSEKAPPPAPSRAEPLSKLLALRKEQAEEEKRLRLHSEREASAIVAREKVQQEIIDKASQPKVVPQEEYDQMLEMKRKQIEHMAKVLNTTNKELAILQEQNADLEKLLAKGELKKKVELIREVEELRIVKDELTEQIQSLFVALEQEKSKTNLLTQELQKRR